MAMKLRGGGTGGSTLLNGILLYWKLDETSGSVVYDSVGSNNGNIYNNTYPSVNGKINGCFDWTNIAGRIDMDSSFFDNVLKNKTAITWSIWFLYEGSTDYSGNGKIGGWGTTVDYAGFFADLQNSKAIRLIARTSGTTAQGNVTSSTLFNLGVWNHVVYMADITAGIIRIYLDGNKIAEQTGITFANASFQQGYGCKIGKRYDNHASGFIGKLDELGIWGRVLTEVEILELYNGGSGKSHPFT